MNSSRRHRSFYKSLPKIELHRHLEGSLRLETMIETAREYQIDVPYDDVDKLRGLVQVQSSDPFSHQNFLSKFQTLRLFYQSRDVIQRVAREAVEDAAADNIHYLELRFTPIALTRMKDFPIDDAMDWVIESCRQASQDYGVKTNLIASVNRHEGVELAEEVVHLAIDRKDSGIVAVDLAGDEANFPGEPFKGIYDEAAHEGLKVTIHAGEWGSAANVIEAIDILGANRIGHGVRVLEDDRAVAMAKEKGVSFEVCITSNYQSGVSPSLEGHPLPAMLSTGLDASINTDDPSLSQIDLSDEYEIACEDVGLELNVLRKTVLNAAHSAFLPRKESNALVELIEHEFSAEIK